MCPEAGWRKGAHVLSCGLGLYSSAATVAAVGVFGGFPPDFSNPLADFVFPLATAGCTGPSLGSQLGLAPQVAMWGFYAAVMIALMWLLWRQKMPRGRKIAAAVAGVALLGAAATFRGPPSAREERSRRWISCEILRCCENDHAAEKGGRGTASPRMHPEYATAAEETSPLPRR
ncbi:MAG: hypothetical protein D6806_01630 [Deltaproteobacteria bacterium]|nr:MAG: hypothetical protein D6806_01630 [Deltaproteobacteria bacterium]